MEKDGELLSIAEEELLSRLAVHFPLVEMITFILGLAERSDLDAEALQDLAQHIRFQLENLIKVRDAIP